MTNPQSGGRSFGAGLPGSRQIAWWPVYEFAQPHLPEQIILPGSPGWIALDDTDPLKRRNLLWPALWWCLAEDTRQEAIADASREISSAAPWSALARRVAQGRGGAYIPRRREDVA